MHIQDNIYAECLHEISSLTVEQEHKLQEDEKFTSHGDEH
jgi:hypothetical protein